MQVRNKEVVIFTLFFLWNLDYSELKLYIPAGDYENISPTPGKTLYLVNILYFFIFSVQLHIHFGVNSSLDYESPS